MQHHIHCIISARRWMNSIKPFFLKMAQQPTTISTDQNQKGVKIIRFFLYFCFEFTNTEIHLLDLQKSTLTKYFFPQLQLDAKHTMHKITRRSSALRLAVTKDPSKLSQQILISFLYLLEIRWILRMWV